MTQTTERATFFGDSWLALSKCYREVCNIMVMPAGSVRQGQIDAACTRFGATEVLNNVAVYRRHAAHTAA